MAGAAAGDDGVIGDWGISGIISPLELINDPMNGVDWVIGDQITYHPLARYLRCLLTSLVISNMLTCFLPPNTGLSLSSALMLRLFLASCRPFFLM